MKILVFSDSHGIVRDMANIYKNLSNDISYIIHLGDFINDVTSLKIINPNIGMYGVLGNCDYDCDDKSMNIYENIIEIMGKKIFFTHGANYNVKSTYNTIINKAKEEQVDLCLFGHTHIPFASNIDNILFMNPGSITRPKSVDYISYGIIDIENDILRVSVVGKTLLGYKVMLNASLI